MLVPAKPLSRVKNTMEGWVCGLLDSPGWVASIPPGDERCKELNCPGMDCFGKTICTVWSDIQNTHFLQMGHAQIP